jgi:hypothetical protein
MDDREITLYDVNLKSIEEVFGEHEDVLGRKRYLREKKNHN